MKKFALLSFLAAILLFAMAFAFNPQNVSGSGNATPAGPGTALPDSIRQFAMKACMDCHADDGSSMAKSKLNFSKWDTYDADKQVKKANAIYKELKSGSMPPKKWRANNPGNVPTAAEIEMIGTWVGSLQK